MNKEETKKEPTRVNLFLDPELVKRAKKRAIDDNISLSQLINNLIKENCPE